MHDCNFVIILGRDYMSRKYTVVFVPNITEVSFNVPVFEDLIQEESEDFRLTITNRTQPRRVRIGQRSQATVTISDTTGELLLYTY